MYTGDYKCICMLTNNNDNYSIPVHVNMVKLSLCIITDNVKPVNHVNSVDNIHDIAKTTIIYHVY